MKSNSKNGYHFIVGMDESLRDRLSKYAHRRELVSRALRLRMKPKDNNFSGSKGGRTGTTQRFKGWIASQSEEIQRLDES